MRSISRGVQKRTCINKICLELKLGRNQVERGRARAWWDTVIREDIGADVRGTGAAPE